MATKKPPKKKKRLRRTRQDARDLAHFGTVCTMVTLHVQLASMAPTPFEHLKALESLSGLIEQVEAGTHRRLRHLRRQTARSRHVPLYGATMTWPEAAVTMVSIVVVGLAVILRGWPWDW